MPSPLMSTASAGASDTRIHGQAVGHGGTDPLLFARFLRVGAFFHAVISRDASPGAIQRPRAILVPQGAKLTQIKAAAPGAA